MNDRTHVSIKAERSSVLTGVMLGIAAMLAFATQDAFTKIIVQEMSVAQVVMVRYWVFAVFAVVWVSRTGALRRALPTASYKLQILRSLLSLAEIALFNLALRYLGLAEAHALMAVFPLVVIALAAPVLGEKVSLKCWLAVMAGFIGTLVILRPGLSVFDPTSVIPLFAALCFAGYHVVTRKVSGLGDGFNTNVLYMALVGCVVTTVFGVSAWREPTLEEWGWLTIISVLSVAAQLLLVKALEYAPASLLQPFNYSLLVFATLIGLFAFGEFPDPWTIIGASVIIISGLYSIHGQGKRH
ncbi:Riboflavin transporter [Marinomonas aquimarina]|uniref:Riboflavin transporter n=1 Tax=Marinomonas aquimarina TaxID=295068 RepID=A0A1A8T4R6_9GAMM|nr:DMT family transporter [Marinomonas aquimarina]SBS27251.1 Riboflavin transporter [Marinomonas aquimarina]